MDKVCFFGLYLIMGSVIELFFSVEYFRLLHYKTPKTSAMQRFLIYFLVGTTGFEPAASCTPCKRATGLRYVPKLKQIVAGLFQAPNFIIGGVQIYNKKCLVENEFEAKPYLRIIPYR